MLDADIRGYYEAIDHEWLEKFVQHRIGDQRIVRLIQKWLKAGVLEHGEWTQREAGGAPRRKRQLCAGEPLPALCV